MLSTHPTLWLILVSLVMGCQKTNTPHPKPQSNSTLSISLQSPEQKTARASGTISTTDDEINDLRLMVFDQQSGNLELHHTASSSEINMRQIVVNTTPGNKTIHIIANPQDTQINNITNFQELEKTPTNLSNLTDQSFTMLGTNQNITITPDKVNQQTIALKRIASRVWLKNITNTSNQKLYIDSIYINNATANVNYKNGQKTGEEKFHGVNQNFKFQNYDVFCPPLKVCICTPFNQSLPQGTHYYLFENSDPLELTTLVITGTMNNQRVYYSVPIHKDRTLNSNTQYNVNVTITGPGDPTPDGDMTGAIGYITIEKWEIIHQDVDF